MYKAKASWVSYYIQAWCHGIIHTTGQQNSLVHNCSSTRLSVVLATIASTLKEFLSAIVWCVGLCQCVPLTCTMNITVILATKMYHVFLV